MIGQNEIELSKFQNILGKVNYDELSLIKLDFENSILKDTYPTLTTEKAYKQFLIDIKNNDASYWNKILPEIKERFNQSNLRLEIYEFPDSVWIEGKDIYSRYIFKNDDGTVAKNEEGTIDYGVSFHSTKNIKNIDSLVKAEYKHSRFKYSGQFFKALKEIKNNSTFLKEYYDLKNSFGNIHPMTMAGIFLQNKVDFSNELIKRLIVVEYICI
jgi:hypothetical protein